MLINSHTISSCKSLVTGTGGLKVEISCEYLKSHYERGFLHKVSFRPKNFRLKYMFSPNWKLHELICVPYINKSISKTKKSQLSLVSAFLSEERLSFLVFQNCSGLYFSGSDEFSALDRNPIYYEFS